ncbi:hypothetical protein DTO271D3_5092 [Paecilomyces variotii]|nr:hypothetical protein DTO271D3_5092 [Paecilomyces variotii]
MYYNYYYLYSVLKSYSRFRPSTLSTRSLVTIATERAPAPTATEIQSFPFPRFGRFDATLHITSCLSRLSDNNQAGRD